MKRFLQCIFTVLLTISTVACSQPTATTQTDTSTPQPTMEVTPEPTKAPTPEPTIAPTSEPTPEPTPEIAEAPTFTDEGYYELFGVMNTGMLVASSDLELHSNITLKEGGGGSMSYEEQTMDITKWERKDDTVSITMTDGGTANAVIHDGILELDINGDASMIMLFAQEGADLPEYKFLSLEEVKNQSN